MEERTRNKSNFMKTTISLLFVFTFLFLSSALIKVQAQPTTYTGEEIFRGVLVGEGPVAGLFPELWEYQKNNGETQAWIDIREQVVSEIKTNDPNFMARFGTEMTSGSHLRVDAILSEARTKFTSATNSSQDAQEFVDSSAPGQESVKVYTRFLLLDEAVAVAKYIFLWVAGTATEDIQESTLYQESITDIVVDRLSS